MNDTFQAFERVYLAPKRYPQFFDYDMDGFNKVVELYKTGYCYPLTERDEDGRRIILVQTRKLDPDVYNSNDAVRILCFVITVLLEEEETQIAGVIFIFDHTDVTMRHAMSPSDLRDFMDFAKKCSACRQKGTYIMNLPSFANVLMELFKSVLSEKLRKRLFLLKSSDELKSFFDPAILPKHYGGVRTEAEMMEDFMKLREQRRNNMMRILKFEIDWSKVPHDKIWSNDEDDTVGSFRKLEID
jgi:hypothetical protein